MGCPATVERGFFGYAHWLCPGVDRRAAPGSAEGRADAGRLPPDLYRYPERPGLVEALAYLREGDVLAVWKLDRLGRSLKDLLEIVTGLESRGIGFRSLQESMDTTTPGGKLIFHVFAALAEFERGVIRERTQAGLMAARARGRQGGRRYKLPQNGRHFARHPVPLCPGGEGGDGVTAARPGSPPATCGHGMLTVTGTRDISRDADVDPACRYRCVTQPGEVHTMIVVSHPTTPFRRRSRAVDQATSASVCLHRVGVRVDGPWYELFNGHASAREDTTGVG
jgi:hypothetical protein